MRVESNNLPRRLKEAPGFTITDHEALGATLSNPPTAPASDTQKPSPAITSDAVPSRFTLHALAAPKSNEGGPRPMQQQPSPTVTSNAPRWRPALEGVAIPVGAVLAALVLFGFFCATQGANPLAVFRAIYKAAFGSW